MRVLVVDDSSAFRRAARTQLERRGHSVVGEASTSVGALLLAAEFTRRFPRVAVLLTSAHDDGVGHSRAEEVGARGFVLKAELASCDLTAFWPPRR